VGKFQEGVDELARCSQDWQLLFNIGNCTIMHFGTKKSKNKYSINGQVMEEVVVEKDVLVVNTLKPSQQCNTAAGNANVILGLVSRAVKYRDERTFVQLYKVYLRPHLEYCIQTWTPYT
jgi:hypothetical protein